MRHRHLLLVPLVIALLCASSAATRGRLHLTRRRAAVRVGRKQRRHVRERLCRAVQPRHLIRRSDGLDAAVRISREHLLVADAALGHRRAGPRVPRAARVGRHHRLCVADAPTRPARRTSPRRAARSLSSTARFRSRAVPRQARARVPRRSPISLATAPPQTMKAVQRPRHRTRRRQSHAPPAGAPTPTRTPTTSQPPRPRP